MRYRSYFAVVLAAAAVLVATTVLVNWLVDPLDVYRTLRQDGFNRVKPSYTPYARLAKPAQIERGDYARLALGSSRVLMGIPMQGNAWAADGTAGFNAGLNGADLRTVRELFEHALALGEVKSVVISVDLFMFNAWAATGKYPYPLATLAETADERFLRQRDTTLRLLFSPGITSASLETLRKQRDKYDKIRLDGSANPAHELRQVLDDGYELRFRQFEDRLVRTGWSPCRDNRFEFTARNIDTLQTFREILQLARAHQIEVKFFISPIHARLLEMMTAAGLADDYEAMKRKLLEAIIAEYGAGMPGVALWDFSGYHHYGIEPVPQQPGAAMQWYTDASHFSQALGALMLDAMAGAPSAQYPFGVQLRPDNIEAALQAWRAQQAAFRAAEPALVADLHRRTAAILGDKQVNGSACKEPVSRQD